MKPRRIRALLVENGITHAEIARTLDIKRQSVDSVIHGRTNSRRVSEEVARRLNLPLDRVFPQYKDAARYATLHVRQQ
ncbi:MAG: helix-turn-helix transcriptional regulator [Desulfuromonadales bacterium]|nr:helix-turn-helix transcriptional regulator [Desulfuromonadales bacterium]